MVRDAVGEKGVQSQKNRSGQAKVRLTKEGVLGMKKVAAVLTSVAALGTADTRNWRGTLIQVK
jgi:hypothetical protein